MDTLSVGYYYTYEITHISTIYRLSGGMLSAKTQCYKKLAVKTAIEQISIYRNSLTTNQVVVNDNEVIKSQMGRVITVLNEKKIEDYLSVLDSLKISNQIVIDPITSTGQKSAVLLSVAGLNLTTIFAGNNSANLHMCTVIPKPDFFGNRTGYVSPSRKNRNFGRIIN